MMKIVAFILTFSIVFVFSKTTPTTLITEAQMNQSSIQLQVKFAHYTLIFLHAWMFLILIWISLQNETRKSGGSCNYKVNIKTSCNSPPHTTDEISILFGDNNASEVPFSLALLSTTQYWIGYIYIYLNMYLIVGLCSKTEWSWFRDNIRAMHHDWIWDIGTMYWKNLQNVSI